MHMYHNVNVENVHSLCLIRQTSSAWGNKFCTMGHIAHQCLIQKFWSMQGGLSGVTEWSL